MKDLLFIYALLPIVYFMYRAGELAVEKGYNPTKWKFQAYLAVVILGPIIPFLGTLALFVTLSLLNFPATPKATIAALLVVFSILGCLVTGFLLLARFKKKSVITHQKRTYRAYDLKNAFLFPSVIPRGGFLWRVICYNILVAIICKPVLLLTPLAKQLSVSMPIISLITIWLTWITFIGVICFLFLYYITYICVPRIRDAGLSRDTLIGLFIPGISLVFLILLFATPTRIPGRSSI